MHAQPSKWFDVSVAMVDCVDVLVQGADVDEPGRAGVTVCTSFPISSAFQANNSWNHL